MLDDTLATIGTVCRQLEELHLDDHYFPSWTYQGLADLLGQLPQLRTLFVDVSVNPIWCDTTAETVLHSLAENCPNLEELFWGSRSDGTMSDGDLEIMILRDR